VAKNEIRSVADADQMKLDRALPERALEQVPELSSAVAELFVGSGPDDVETSRNLAEPKWTRLGVGALYATSRQYGPGRLWVLLLYGR
jgi:hypothetical protein